MKQWPWYHAPALITSGFAPCQSYGTSRTRSWRAGLLVTTPCSAYQEWQMLYFGCTDCAQAQPNADRYGKGISNTNQFLAGLNPTNPASVFRITSIASQGADVAITWKTAGGRTNVVQANPDISYDTKGFADISGPIIINVVGDTTTDYTDIGGATNVPTRFYRVRLVPSG